MSSAGRTVWLGIGARRQLAGSACQSSLLSSFHHNPSHTPHNMDASTSSSPSPAHSKSVSFNPTIHTNTTSSPITPKQPTMKRRRSSLKQGTVLPHQPPREFYQHPDPIIRRLRLRNGFGSQVKLLPEFAGVQVVLFLFG